MFKKVRCSRSCIYYIVLVYLCLTFLVLFHTLINGAWPYLENTTGQGISCLTESNRDKNDSTQTDYLPAHIHQMFFYVTDKTIPSRLVDAQQTWKNKHPSFQYTLWNSTMVDVLIRTRYPELWTLYNSYGHWVRRADVARYVVLHHFGGIYVDLDIKANEQTLDVLNGTLDKNVGVALCLTKPVGVTNDFMMAKPRHPFLEHVLCGLSSANRWYILPYLTTMMSTGPGYLSRRYLTYNARDQIHAFNETFLSSYVRHIAGASWHQWDGVVIWWTFQHLTIILRVTGIIVLFLIVLVIIYKVFKRYGHRCLCLCRRWPLGSRRK